MKYMRKLLLLLSLALLFSCNEEECSQKQISPTINENNTIKMIDSVVVRTLLNMDSPR